MQRLTSAAESFKGMQEVFLRFLGDIDPLNQILNDANAYKSSVLRFG